MKKFSILALIAILLVTLCSCGGDTSANSHICEVCHDKDKKTAKYTIVLGQTKETGYMCKDCAAEKELSINALGGTVK